jgi:hypothetical protein
MSRYKFSAAERYAVYMVHGEACYLCKRPIDLQSMHVDHIIPEALLEKPAELASALHELGLPATFAINSYENWMPSCAPCNGRKRARVFRPAPIFLEELARAKERASEASKLASEVIRRKEVATALNLIERAADRGDLSDADKQTISALMPFHLLHRRPEVGGEPIKLTPLYEVVSDDGFRKFIRGPYGVGVRPSGHNVDPSWNCPNCGHLSGWNGARCVICGAMNDE